MSNVIMKAIGAGAVYAIVYNLVGLPVPIKKNII